MRGAGINKFVSQVASRARSHRIGRLLAGRSGQTASGVSPGFYYKMYEDVASANMDAVDHYFLHGWKEGRNPSKEFNTLYYVVTNMPEGFAENPLMHYQAQGGARSGLKTAPETEEEWIRVQKAIVASHFDDRYYINRYKKHMGRQSPLDHYFSAGWSMGCDPCEHFRTSEYIAANSHIRSSRINPFFHFLVTSRSVVSYNPDPPEPPASVDGDRVEALQAISPYFDSDFYLEQYQDVAEAKVNPLIHFVDFGWKEGRNPCIAFDTSYYTRQYGKYVPGNMNPFLHYLTQGRNAGFKPNPIGATLWEKPRAPEDSAWGRLRPLVCENEAAVTVIVPVYKGYHDTLAAIYAVLANPQKAKVNLLVINDCSPDELLTSKLRELAQQGLFVYVENNENIGFVKSVNKAVGFYPRSDVILLNSDTLVYGNWIDRMLAHASADPKIATITPYSNNASICSYPDPNRENVLALEVSREWLDKCAGLCNRGKCIDIPTGVGFCFYMRRSVIEKIGAFDTAFGRGYGEENDFCMRALKAGYRNVLAQDIFVYHSGGVSFAEIRSEEYTPGQRVLAAKHPDYESRVRSYLKADLGLEGRARIDLFRIARQMGPRSAVLVTFDGAGGVDKHVKELARRLDSAGVNAIIFFVNGENLRLEIPNSSNEIYTPSVSTIDITLDVETIRTFLKWLDPLIVHVHSFALASWQATRTMMDLLSKQGNLFITIHDFDPICHRHHLVNLEGRFCEKIVDSVCRTCLKNDHEVVNKIDPVERRRSWRGFLRSASQIFVPSTDTATRLKTIYPELSFTVREHEEVLPDAPPLLPPMDGEPINIVAIGAIGPHKGVNILHSLALDASLRNLPLKFHIVGYSSAPQEMSKVGIVETGPYKSNDECIKLIEKIGPAFAIFPSIWPETYCYSLSIALKLGLPPIVFDIGALAERVRKAGFGIVLSRSFCDSPPSLNNLLLELDVQKEWSRVKPVEFQAYENFPYDYYQVRSEGRSD